MVRSVINIGVLKSNDKSVAPDLQPIMITQEYISKIKNTLPLLPNELFDKFTKEFGLSDYDAQLLTNEKAIALILMNSVFLQKTINLQQIL